jgi:hypothetical protein
MAYIKYKNSGNATPNFLRAGQGDDVACSNTARNPAFSSSTTTFRTCCASTRMTRTVVDPKIVNVSLAKDGERLAGSVVGWDAWRIYKYAHLAISDRGW